MAQLSVNSVQILDGAVTLTKRDNSAAWQARYKIGSKWIRTTTKQKELARATKTAQDIYLRATFREAEGLPIVTKRFDTVAKQTSNKLLAALKANEGKKVFEDYIRVIKNYLIPFFGSYNITSIDFALMERYAIWRKNKIGHEVKASTINTHNSALNKIFEEAMLHGFMTKANVPMLINRGLKSERRSDFTLEEYRYLVSFMRDWVNEVEMKRSKSIAMRQLLRDYVLILANTGMRHGTESYGIKWKHLSWHMDGDRRVLMISVNGKTKQRELAARDNCTAYFKRIHDRADDLQEFTFEELIDKGIDKYVFRLGDGTRTKNLAQTFEILMKDSELLLDRRTNSNRTLYSLRHTYATFALLYEKLDLFDLEKQMGTSAEMIRKHYAHITTRMIAGRLAGTDYEKIKREREEGIKLLNEAEAEDKN
ncbi:XerC Integrase [Methylophilaceae bacterium]